MKTGFIAHVDPQTGEITRVEIVARTDGEAETVRRAIKCLEKYYSPPPVAAVERKTPAG